MKKQISNWGFRQICESVLEEMGGNAKEICCGDCTTFAIRVIDLAGCGEIVDCLEEEMKSEIDGYAVIKPEENDNTLSHCYLHFNGEFFDAFNPEGVERETELAYHTEMGYSLR